MLSRELWTFVSAESPILDGSIGAPCLVHGDFDGSNILVRETGGRWEVAGVLDWEYAVGATPMVDIGHILRPPLGDLEPFERGLIAGFVDRGGRLPPDWERVCRLLDLLNWVSYLNRPGAGPNVRASAREMIVRTIRRRRPPGRRGRPLERGPSP